MSYKTDIHTTTDFLNFGDFRPALREIIETADTPLTVGVFGPWGSGKTSLLQMLRNELEETQKTKARTVWFTAWKYDRQDALWRAFILRVLDSLYPRQAGEGPRENRPRLAFDQLNDAQQGQVKMLDRLQESVYRQVEWSEVGKWTVDWLQLAKEGQEGIMELATALLPVPPSVQSLLKAAIGSKRNPEGATAAIRRQMQQHHREQLTSMEQFETTFGEALRTILGKEGRLVIFVDDLDRCLPEKAIEVLEAIKLFLEVEGTVFVLGMDREVVQRGVETRYGTLLRQAQSEGRDFPISGDTYLQKIIQLPFHLPPLAVEDMDDFLDKVEGSAHDALDEMTRKVFARGLFANPRQAKRCLNIFRLLRAIAEERQKRPDEEGGLPADSIAWPLLAKTVVIQTQYPRLYQLWRLYPTIVQTLETEYARLPSDEEAILHGVTSTAARQDGEAMAASDEELSQEDTAPAAETTSRTSGRPTVRTAAGGILAPFLEDRQRYALLEQMLTYPPDERILEGAGRTHFAGLSRDEMRAYLRLAGTASTDERVDLPDAPDDIMGQLLSGDASLIQEAASQLQSQAPEEDAPLRQSVRQRLEHEITNAQQPAKARVSAGTGLALLGDQRSGVGLDAEGLPDIAWCAVPEGRFQMGTSDGQEEAIVKLMKDAYGDQYKESDIREWIQHEKPQHEVTLPGYRIAKYPVTNAQYGAFVVATEHEPPQHWSGQELPIEIANHPVVNVTWYDAMAFCEWLSQVVGSPVRLPFEMEWEKAARGDDGRLFPWGDEFDAERCNMNLTEIEATAAVGVFPGGASPYEAMDMAGNVWEWTGSLWGADVSKAEFGYPYDAGDGRENLEAGEDICRVVRGGSFVGDVVDVRCAVRDGDNPRDWNLNWGFRILSPGL